MIRHFYLKLELVEYLDGGATTARATEAFEVKADSPDPERLEEILNEAAAHAVHKAIRQEVPLENGAAFTIDDDDLQAVCEGVVRPKLSPAEYSELLRAIDEAILAGKVEIS